MEPKQNQKIETNGQIILPPRFHYSPKGVAVFKVLIETEQNDHTWAITFNEYAEKLANRFSYDDIVSIKGRWNYNDYGEGSWNIMIDKMEHWAIEGTTINELIQLTQSAYNNLESRMEKGSQMILDDPQNPDVNGWRIRIANMKELQQRLLACVNLLQYECRILETKTENELILKYDRIANTLAGDEFAEEFKT